MPAIIPAAALAISAYSAYQSNANAQKAQHNSDVQINDQKAAQKAQDDALALQQKQDQNKQLSDAQWMQMRSQANKMAGAMTQAPTGLATQNGAQGAAAGATAGKTLLGA